MARITQELRTDWLYIPRDYTAAARRKCDEGTCHVGITTHIKDIEEALAKGLKSFVPREYEESVDRIVRMFEGIATEMRELTAQLGATCPSDLTKNEPRSS